MNDLKPCPNPWCQSDRIDFSVSPSGHNMRHYCRECGLQGPPHMSIEKAAEAWNTRPPCEAERLLEWMHDQRGSLYCSGAKRCVADAPDLNYTVEGETPLDALKAAKEAKEAMEDEA